MKYAFFLCFIRAMIEPQEFLNVVQVMGKQFSKDRFGISLRLFTNTLQSLSTFHAIDTLAMKI